MIVEPQCGFQLPTSERRSTWWRGHSFTLRAARRETESAERAWRPVRDAEQQQAAGWIIMAQMMGAASVSRVSIAGRARGMQKGRCTTCPSESVGQQNRMRRAGALMEGTEARGQPLRRAQVKISLNPRRLNGSAATSVISLHAREQVRMPRRALPKPKEDHGGLDTANRGRRDIQRHQWPA